jgi:putative sugar O-methyltransferase
VAEPRLGLPVEGSLTSLKGLYDRAREYVDHAHEAGLIRPGEISDFWAEILESRGDYPTFNEVLVMRRGFTASMADAGAGDVARESRAAEAAYAAVAPLVPPAFLQTVDESLLGAPLTFEIGGRMRSAGGVVNSLTTFRILRCCEQRGLAGRPLRVLEIGAGYGQVASQLIQRLDVRSYAVCDLPQNLLLSAFYLQASFPGRPAAFVRADAPPDDEAALLFTVPALLHRLAGPFDLVVNSYSFQEMNLASVQEYFAFVSERLTPQGLFYSLNAHAKSGVRRPADYPVGRFHLLGFAPVRKFPHHTLLATSPYEMVMGRRAQDEPADGGALTRGIDALATLMQLGVHDELVESCDRVVRQPGVEEPWIGRLCDFFSADRYTQKLEVLRDLRQRGCPPAVGEYLVGTLAFAAGRHSDAEPPLRAASAGLSASPALAWSLAMLAVIAGEGGRRGERDELTRRAREAIPHLAAEIGELIAEVDGLREHLARLIHLREGRPRLDLHRLRRRFRRKFLGAKRI